jgi:lipopolysaccharide export LptBFGC system permease protein LptF
VTESPLDAAGNVVTYAYRPSVMGAVREFKLSDDGIDWAAGVRSGHIPYRNIRLLRMSYRPTSIQSQRFVTELWGEGAPKLTINSSSWKSMVEQERLDQSYSAFIRELHLRISKVATSARFAQGSRPLIYWPSLVVFVAVALALAGLIARALQIGASGGAAFVGAFLALYLWQGGNFLRRNRPGEYCPGALPKEVMPPQ